MVGEADLRRRRAPPNPDERTSTALLDVSGAGSGQADLGAETTYSASATTTYQGERVAAEVSAYEIHLITSTAPAIDQNGDPVFDVSSAAPSHGS
jgi:hypothetical protein